ncbi:hypothetical protein AX16_004273 [Volvariella volvacea WC 439]|nr:hypothetical protein AX16_004273 [Volvariella volvacea WC 439]
MNHDSRSSPHPQAPNAARQGWELFNHAIVDNKSGTITINAPLTTNINPNYHSIARDLLRARIIPEAMHTGKIHAEPLTCHPDTRQAIIEDIIVWVEDNERTHHILWLRGPAGIGKSAIAKTVADHLDRPSSRATVAGSFFFVKRDPRRNTLTHFVATIVYRLAVTFEDLGKKIEDVIYRDPEVLGADIAVQWQKLVIETVATVSDLLPAVIIIDEIRSLPTVVPPLTSPITKMTKKWDYSFAQAFHEFIQTIEIF